MDLDSYIERTEAAIGDPVGFNGSARSTERQRARGQSTGSSSADGSACTWRTTTASDCDDRADGRRPRGCPEEEEG